MSKRHDSVLSDAEINAYRANGYLVIRNLLSASEVREGNEAASRIINDPNIAFEFNRRTPVRKQRDGTWFVEKVDPISDISPFFDSISKNSYTSNIARALLSVKEVVIFKDKFIYKRPGQDGYPLHQDYNWWHDYDPDKILTIAIAFDDCDENNGAIEFFGGHHQISLNSKGTYGELPASALEALSKAESEIPSLKAGDAVAFHSLTPHCSGRNMSNRMRRIYYPSFADATLQELAVEHYQRHWAKMEEAMPSILRDRMCFI